MQGIKVASIARTMIAMGSKLVEVEKRYAFNGAETIGEPRFSLVCVFFFFFFVPNSRPSTPNPPPPPHPESILKHGGSVKNKCTLTDEYLDMSDWGLTLRDHWLRRRNGIW
jgi:hypothetical protein